MLTDNKHTDNCENINFDFRGGIYDGNCQTMSMEKLLQEYLAK